MKYSILGVLVNNTNLSGATEMILTAARQRQPLAVSALAVHGVMTGVLDPEHLYRLNHIDLVVADGQPVRWALNLLYKAGLGHRVYGPTLMDWTLNFAEKQGLSVYFYGSTQPVLNRMCCKLRQKFPNLRIAGSQPSRFGPLTAESADQIAAQIRASGAHMVFVGLGCPRQEVWAFEFRERLGMPIIAVGAAFPFSAGLLKQAPAWMQNSGMEWFFRLCTEPRRLWRRYLLLSPAYLFLVLCQHLGIEFQSVGQQPTQEILHG